MGRGEVQDAVYQFLGGTANTNQTTLPLNTFGTPGINTIVRGEPFDALDYEMPVLYVLVPASRERRWSAQFKMVDYQIALYIIAEISGISSSGDGGPQSIMDQYAWVDNIGALIRTNKTLAISAYPNGALIRFGEFFTVRTTHKRRENSMLLFCRMLVSGTEQVQA